MEGGAAGKIEVGAVIRKVWGIYVDQAPVLMPAAAVVFVFTGIISVLLLQSNAGLGLLAALIGLIATTLFTGMVVELVADVQDGRRDATPGQLLRAAAPVLGSLILIAIVVGVLTLIGFLLLIVPGLIALTVWSVAAPVVVLERPPGLKAMRRSRELVSGNGWPVFGVILVLGVAVAVLSGAIEIAAESAGTGAGIVARVVLGVLTAPLSALAAAVLYFELLRVHGQEARPGAVAGRGSVRRLLARTASAERRARSRAEPRREAVSCCAPACWRACGQSWRRRRRRAGRRDSRRIAPGDTRRARRALRARAGHGGGRRRRRGAADARRSRSARRGRRGALCGAGAARSRCTPRCRPAGS